MTCDSERENLDRKLGELTGLTRQDLVDHWIRQFGCAPPKGIKRRLLERAASFQIQAKCHGGLKPSTRKALSTFAVPDRPANKSAPLRPKAAVSPGMRLAREWQGEVYTVDVTETGFLCRGHHHRSLSAVARAITGARWSGPRFFGL